MSGETDSEQRTPSQATIDNTVAIKELATISKQTTKDIDRLVKHIDKILPIHEKLANTDKRVDGLEEESNGGLRPTTHKKLTYSIIIIAIGFGTWMTLEHFSDTNNLDVHKAHQEEKEKDIEANTQSVKSLNEKVEEIKINLEIKSEKINNNTNQITYLKGRIKQ